MRHFSVMLLMLVGSVHLFAQWSTDPANPLLVGYGMFPQIASDSAGGCFITYQQGLYYPRHLALLRLNRNGYNAWGGIKHVTGIWPDQSSAKIIPDGSNGAIIAYADEFDTLSTASYHIRVQRVDSSGTFLWGPSGVRVSLSETNQQQEQVVSDGQGGCIVAWVDTGGALFINRINQNGDRAWGDSGKYVWNSPQTSPLVPDGEGGSYVVYGIGRLQRFDKDGVPYWPSPGVLVPMGAASIAVDSSHNVYLFGSIFIGVNQGIYQWTKNIQKVSPSGIGMWDSLGVIVDTEKTNNPSPNYSMLVSSGGFVHLGWGNNSNDTTISFIQNLFTDGRRQFLTNRTFGSKSSKKIGIEVLPTDSSKVIYSWMDFRDGYWNLWAQKQDTAGRVYWDTGDVAVTRNGFSDYWTISDGHDGMIAMWFVTATFSIYAQQISTDGHLGQIITGINERTESSIPADFSLHPNYPNPFNPSTTISYRLPAQGNTAIKIYDLLGRELETLFEGEQTPGEHMVQFNAQSYASGMYIIRLTAHHAGSLTRKVLLMK